MKPTCSNCGKHIIQDYCHHCGQQKRHKIDGKYVVQEIEYALWHINKGFVHSILCIIRNPGKTARDYLHGKRIKHYKPITLAIVLSAFVGWLYTFLDWDTIFESPMLNLFTNENMPQQLVESTKSDARELFEGSLKYSNLITLLAIPLFALISRFTFRKQPENYYEHVVMNAYVQVLFSIVSIVTFPLVYLFSIYFLYVTVISFLLMPLIILWFFNTYYHEMSLKQIIFKTNMMLAIGLIFYFILSIAYAIIKVNYLISTGQLTLPH